MRFQRRPGFCGPAAVVNAVRCFGKKIAEARIGAAAGCTESEGSSPEEIIEAIRTFGFGATRFETSDKNAAWGWLIASLRDGKPVVVLVLNDGHYVTIVAALGNRVVVVDSTNEKKNRKENGIHVLSKREFMKKWYCATGGTYFGISIGKK